MHIVDANFYLLSVTGPKMPADLTEESEKKITSKAEVIAWLKRSLELIKNAHVAGTSKDLERKVRMEGQEATVDGIYLRISPHSRSRQ
jgi:hypothetical protein